MIILKKLINYLTSFLILLCIIHLSRTYYLDIQALNEDLKEEQLKRNQKKSKLYDGNISARVLIDKIDLDKVLIQSTDNLLQKNIDKNNLVTTDNLTNRTLIIYGHYTQIPNLVLNRIYELKKDDLIQLKYDDTIVNYKISQTGKIDNINKLKDNDYNLVIVSCTKDFSKKQKYYVKARKL